MKKKPTRKKAAKAAPKADKVLVLRTCKADMTSYGGFKWPQSGPVEAPDWKLTQECGNGLHGFLWGEGDGSLANWSSDAKWPIVAVDAGTVVDLSGKVKFPRGEVVFCGDRVGATGYLLARIKEPRKVIGAVVVAGDWGTATAGDGGTISILWYDRAKQTLRRAVAAYRVDENGKFQEAK